jgi:predicted nucleotidyltransferase
MEAWAYGSRVSGRAHALSDLDLVIRNPADLKKKQGPEFWELKEALSESNILCIVDLHDWARLPAEFHPNIEEQHVTLQTPEGNV